MININRLIALLDESAASYDPACVKLAELEQQASRVAPGLAPAIREVRQLLEASAHPFSAVHQELDQAVTARRSRAEQDRPGRAAARGRRNIENKLRHVQRLTGMEYVISRNKVPHLVADKGRRLSVAYFHKTDTFRLFVSEPGVSLGRRRYDYREAEHVAEAVNSLRAGAACPQPPALSNEVERLLQPATIKAQSHDPERVLPLIARELTPPELGLAESVLRLVREEGCPVGHTDLKAAVHRLPGVAPQRPAPLATSPSPFP